jgi:hypothetical protein
MLIRFLGQILKMPAPIREKEHLKQKTLVMLAHDKNIGALAALMKHMNNIHLGKGYTVLQTHFHAEDELVKSQKGLFCVKIDIEAHMMTSDPDLAGEIALKKGPVYFEWPVYI